MITNDIADVCMPSHTIDVMMIVSVICSELQKEWNRKGEERITHDAACNPPYPTTLTRPKMLTRRCDEDTPDGVTRESELVNVQIRLEGCSESNRLYLVSGFLFLESLSVTDFAVSWPYPCLSLWLLLTMGAEVSGI